TDGYDNICRRAPQPPGLSVVLHVLRQSNEGTIRRWVRDPDGQVIEIEPPSELPGSKVVVLQPS
ncbi:MAG TPA: hypothetical protein VGF22_09975, partial [Acidimicrobiales bacterium]